MDAALEEDGFGERRQGVPVSARRSVKRPAPSAEEDLSQTTVASNQSGKSQSLKDSRTENSFE